MALNVFISQPMAGLTTQQITQRRDHIAELVKNRYGNDVVIIDSILTKQPTNKNPSVHCLGTSLQLMADADLAVFDIGYEFARGCRIEHQVAIDYNIDLAYVSDLI